MLKISAVAALLWAGGFPLPSAAQGSLRYTVELEGLRQAAQRMELRRPGWRLLAWERGEEPAAEALRLGLECPWAAVGPVAPRGLLRALSNPLSYGPGSALFEERAGLRLDGSLRAASRRGVWVEPLPGRLGLFGLHTPQQVDGSLNQGLAGLAAGRPVGLLQAGGCLAWLEPAGGVELEALALLSLPPAPPAPEEWLVELPPFPAGKLAHLGGRLRLQGAGGLDCSLLSAASGGERVQPGLFFLGCLGAVRGPWEARASAGACSSDYRSPDGELRPEALAAGLRLELRPAPAWRLEGSWRGVVDRSPAVPGRRRPGYEQGGLLAGLDLALGSGRRLEVQAEARVRAQYEADGGVKPEAGGDLRAELRGKRGELGLDLRGAWRPGGGELRGWLWGQRPGLQVRVGAAWEPSAATALRPCVRLELAGQDYRFWLSAGDGKGGEGLLLGWSVAQPLSSSPTGSTSRSRR